MNKRRNIIFKVIKCYKRLIIKFIKEKWKWERYKENMNLMSYVDNLLNFKNEQINFFK